MNLIFIIQEKHMIKVNIHGKLGQEVGEFWDLDVVSVSEALRAIEANTGKLRNFLLENKEEFEYQILINKENLFNEVPKFETIEDLKNSEFFLDISEKVDTIDIIPEIIGSDFWSKAAGIFLGAVSIAAAIFVPFVAPVLAFAVPGLLFAGIGLIAAGVSSLLSKPPPNVPFTAQQADAIDGSAGGPSSYLFNGPNNTVGEGGPVPVGYGELIVGGHNIMSNFSYNVNASKSSFDSTSKQVSLYATPAYIFNNRGFLISQTPGTSEI